MLQAELKRLSVIELVEDKDALRIKEEAGIEQGINQIRLREHAYSNFEGATHEERRAMHQFLFKAVRLERAEDGRTILIPAAGIE